jgi:hypothetical protein
LPPFPAGQAAVDAVVQADRFAENRQIDAFDQQQDGNEDKDR